MQNKLILVEGLPGTGKTTLSERIFTLLSGQGLQVELLLEGNKKIPSNFYNIAGIPKNDFAGVLNDLLFIAETGNYIFIDMRRYDGETANQLLRYDVGDEFNKFISAQEYARCTLEWWQNWVKYNMSESFLIMDSAFMQCPINEMIFRGASDPEVMAYIQTIAEIIKPFNPVCVYLRRENAEIAIDFAKMVKGEHWAKGVEGLADFGWADLFERRFSLENFLLPSIHNFVCEVIGYDWSDAELKINKYFS
jgi:hypothetical protein